MLTTVCRAAAGVAVLALTGCASLVAPPYSPDYATLDRLKGQPLQKVSVGSFRPTEETAPVNTIGLRAARLISPRGSFAKYLEDALIQDLREVSLHDPGSALRVEATVVRNTIDIGGISTGSGHMQIELAVVRGATPVLKKTYEATTQFESSFAGNIAIPKGQLEYVNLVRALLAKVYADPAFINALKS
jgi:hypothetical protein